MNDIENTTTEIKEVLEDAQRCISSVFKDAG